MKDSKGNIEEKKSLIIKNKPESCRGVKPYTVYLGDELDGITKEQWEQVRYPFKNYIAGYDPYQENLESEGSIAVSPSVSKMCVEMHYLKEECVRTLGIPLDLQESPTTLQKNVKR